MAARQEELTLKSNGAVAGRLQLSRHRRALRTSSRLTQIFRRMYKRKAAIVTPEAVIQILNRSKVRFVVMGAHGIGGWLYEARASQDVNVLIQKSHHRKAVKAVKQAYPSLLIQDLPAVTRFLDPLDGKPVIDLMKPEEPLYREAFKNPVKVGKTHFVPNLEMALAAKYGAMLSPHRAAEKCALDEADFISMVKANYDRIDPDVLFSFGEMVKNGGGQEILRFVDQARAGSRLRLQLFRRKDE